MASRVGKWLRRALEAAAGQQVILLKDLEGARHFPVQTPLDVRAPRRSDGPSCGRCKGSMSEVLLTTGGSGSDRAVWEAHPLAVDGWYCSACSEVCVPRALEPDEAWALLDAAVAHARAQRFDDAELALRRVASSWPRYPAARLQLALLYAQRLAARDQIRRDRAGTRLAAEMLRQLDDLLALLGTLALPAASGAGIARLDVLLLAIRAALRCEDRPGALARLDAELARGELGDEDRALLEGLRAWVLANGDDDDERARRRDLGLDTETGLPSPSATAARRKRRRIKTRA